MAARAGTIKDTPTAARQTQKSPVGETSPTGARMNRQCGISG
jgi:hypothetical protein